jgi:hypothetical protein
MGDRIRGWLMAKWQYIFVESKRREEKRRRGKRRAQFDLIGPIIPSLEPFT